MHQASKASALIASGFAVVALASAGEAQERATPAENRAQDVVTITPGAQYRAGAWTRAILGSGWRDVWTTPVQAPVLDPATYAGGLKLTERGGGFHSIVLHLDEETGWREYRFRSVDKFPMQGMPPSIKGTLLGRFFEDQVSILFPAAPLLVPPLHEAIGVLHVTPRLYVMGDSPRLQQVRDSVAGMLGTMELKGEEAPDDQPGFAGSRAIKGTEGFFEALDASRENRLDEREFLAVRMIDFLINDTDRTPDNSDWARFGEKGDYTWRTLPRDRDQAFMDARGLLNALVVRRVYPKNVAFTPDFPLTGLTHTSHVLDRRLLQRLTAADFHDVALRVQRAVDDAVIARVVAQLPSTWRDRTSVADRITSVLRARRDRLPEVAMAFYRDLASEVDVHGTAEADRVDVMRHADGRVTVTITDPERAVAAVENRADGSVITTAGGTVAASSERKAYYERTFVPGETKEIRLYAGKGDDVAIVRGAPSGAIAVRLIGGGGNDTLTDSAGGRGDTFLYDAEGENVFLTASGTHVSTKAWKPVTARSGFRLGDQWRPDWGGSSGWGPTVDYHSGAGIILGAGPRFKSYGFRRLPHEWQAKANLLVGTENGRLGLTLDADYRAENSPLVLELAGRATQLEATRFFGYGNNTPTAGRDENLVDQRVVAVEPAVVWQIGWRSREWVGNPVRGDVDTSQVGLRPLVGELRVGPVLSWIDPEPTAISLLSTSGVAGAESFALTGARLGLELDRTDSDPVPTSGWNVSGELAAYPALLGLDDAFGTATAGGSFYVPLVKDGPHLAFRARGALASSGYPAQFAAAVGGKNTLRGYPWRRFAGDAAVNGGAELRVPIGTLNFIVKSNVGVFVLADAGRVWFDGSSNGGWHTGLGGGLWFSAFGKAVSVAYAQGETHRVYVKSGLFY